MPTVSLQCHPGAPCGAVRSIDVTVASDTSGALQLQYAVHGTIADLKLPEPAPPRRADGLWRHTCFEVFWRLSGHPQYHEWNFSPSGAWAAYRFDDYRLGMAPLETVAVPDVVARAEPSVFLVEVAVEPPPFGADAAPALDLALSAVIEERDGRLSYWALRHAPEQPDFHHPDGFVLTLRPDDPGCGAITRI
jgi:hypothetical protein